MKSSSTQFGVRENTASSRQHASRRAADSMRSLSETFSRSLQHRRPRPVSESRASEPDEPSIATPLDAATGDERGDSVETSFATATVTTANESRQTFEPLIGCADAAKLLGNIHVKTLQRYARTGTLAGYRIGGHWYFRISELDSWLRSRVNSNCQSVR